MTIQATPSFQDLVDDGKGEIQSRRPELVFADGDVTEAFVHAGAAMFDRVVGWLVNRLRALYFGTAKGADLDTLIMDRLRIPRELGEKAYGDLVLTRIGSGSGGTIVAGTVFMTGIRPDGSAVGYALDADFTASSGAFSSTAAATCTEFGKVGNRKAGDSSVLFPQSTLFDTSIVCTNPDGMAGGNDSELDEDYLARAVGRWLTQRRGVLDAIEEGAMSVAGVAVARATENLTTGIATVYVSDSDGNSTQQMVHNVSVALDMWRAAGVPITVIGGQRAGLTITLSVDEYAKGFDVAAGAQRISDSVTTRCNLLRVGEDFTLDAIKAAAIAPFAPTITKVSVAAAAVNTVAVPTWTDIAANGMLVRIDSITIIDGKA